MNGCFFFLLALFFLSNICGCSGIKEMGRGFLGVSTQVLEDSRKNSLSKSYALSYDDCYLKVKKILNQAITDGTSGPLIYAEDPDKKMIAFYLSSSDTTPVGIFFSKKQTDTLIEISSPSTYAKETIAGKVFGGLDQEIKEKTPDVKEKPIDK